MRGLEKIFGDRHTYTHTQTHRHFNTVNRPGLRAGSIENTKTKKIFFNKLDKGVELVGRGSVINGAYSV